MEGDGLTENFDARQAAQTFVDATRWQDSLVQRTEGLSWLVWAAVAPAIVLTLAYLGEQVLPMWVVMSAWVPWVILGYATTHILWRTAAITRPELPQPTWQGYAVKALIMAGLLLVLHFIIKPHTMAPTLALIGVAWIGIGFFVRRLSLRGRRASVVGGTVVVLVALVMGLAATAMNVTMTVSVVTLGVVPAAVGLYQAMSG
jgi:hypothetical protein